jgi:hypothetical protein
MCVLSARRRRALLNMMAVALFSINEALQCSGARDRLSSSGRLIRGDGPAMLIEPYACNWREEKEAMQKTRAFLGAVSAVLFAIGTANAGLIGSLTTGDGLVGGGNWQGSPDDDGFKVSWDVSQNPDDTWRYTYTFTNEDGEELSPETSHFIIQLSDNISEDDLFNFSGDFGDIEFGTFGEGAGNPGFPGGESIFGVKINMEGDQLTVTFDSNRFPQWSDFYAKGGATSFVYNEDIGVEVANLNDYNGVPVDEFGNELAKVLAPDTIIPEPASLSLIAVAMLFALRRR